MTPRDVAENARGPSWRRPDWPPLRAQRTHCGARRRLGRGRQGGRRQGQGAGAGRGVELLRRRCRARDPRLDPGADAHPRLSRARPFPRQSRSARPAAAERTRRSSIRAPTASARPISTGRSSSTRCSGSNSAPSARSSRILRRTYCQTLGVEFLHISDGAQKGWIQERIEGPDKEITFTREGKRAILNKLVEAEGFEKFCDVKFTGTKRFGLDGGESMIPALEQIIKRGGALGVREIVIGMAHRGRLNVLAQVMAKPHRAIFHEFKGGSSTPNEIEGSGDVKYHLGASSDREFDDNKVHLSLTANPSHLEIVDPVVLGKVRAKQDQLGATPEDRTMVMPLLIHGDASFAGQGVVAECFGLSGLRGHRTGGSVHFIVNNQIGFTTNPRYSRSSPYPSDVAKMIEAPIFHVNGDDPEAVVFAAKVATEFRQKFQKPVVIDMFCYRRHGHNEGDEPSFTQPLMYKAIAAHPTTLEIYGEKLVGEGVVTAGEVEKMKADWREPARCRARSGAELPRQQSRLARRPLGRLQDRAATATIRAAARPASTSRRSRRSARRSPRCPTGFHLHRTLSRFLENRRKSIETGANIDWATGEALAFCSLLLDGHRVRLSGQDCERGTFSQRHSVLIDQETERRYTPFNHLRDGQARYEVINSMLSEEAVLGFEYGYSLAEPNALTLWEAQFGDFANGAQVLFDQFISSGRAQMAAHVGPRLPAAARLRRPGAGALLRAARALSADVRRRQYAGRQLHDAGELFPHPAPPAQSRLPQAADPDDAEIAAAPQARGVAARRNGTGDVVPPAALGRRADCSPEREDQARRRRQDPARRHLLRQGLLRSLRRAREARRRRHLSAAHRAALSVPDQGADEPSCRASSRRRSSGARKSRATWAAGCSSISSWNGCSTRSAPNIAARATPAGRPRPRPRSGRCRCISAQLKKFLEER